MSTNTTVEERLADLESQVAELRRKVEKRVPARDWLNRMMGAFRKYPEFGEVIEYGRQIRESEPIDDESEA
jgi:hypothetical protein